MPVGSTQIDGHAADAFLAAAGAGAGRLGEAEQVGLVLSLKAAPRNLLRVPRRTITHGAPASVPRSCSSFAVRSTVAKPNALAKASAAEVGLLELQPGDVVNLDDRIAGAPGMLPGPSALLAVQVSVGTDGVAHPDSSRI